MSNPYPRPNVPADRETARAQERTGAPDSVADARTPAQPKKHRRGVRVAESEQCFVYPALFTVPVPNSKSVASGPAVAHRNAMEIASVLLGWDTGRALPSPPFPAEGKRVQSTEPAGTIQLQGWSATAAI